MSSEPKKTENSWMKDLMIALSILAGTFVVSAFGLLLPIALPVSLVCFLRTKWRAGIGTLSRANIVQFCFLNFGVSIVALTTFLATVLGLGRFDAFQDWFLGTYLLLAIPLCLLAGHRFLLHLKRG